MKKRLRKSLQRITAPIPAPVLFRSGAALRRLRRALSGRASLDFLCRFVDFLCCSLAPKILLRHVSCKTGSLALWICVNDPSHYDLVSGMYETCVLKWLQENAKSGDTFLDVGANIGFYSVIASSLVGRAGCLIAVEADPAIAALLSRNFDVNGLSNARVISGAMLDYTGESTVRLGRAPATGWTGLYYARADEWIEVPAITGDSLLNLPAVGRINAIKIDVEGAEARVLRGMTTLIEKMNPRLLIEIHRCHRGVEDEVTQLLAQLHFEWRILDRTDATMHIAATRN